VAAAARRREVMATFLEGVVDLDVVYYLRK
jgi:hypothetical protein